MAYSIFVRRCNLFLNKFHNDLNVLTNTSNKTKLSLIPSSSSSLLLLRLSSPPHRRFYHYFNNCYNHNHHYHHNHNNNVCGSHQKHLLVINNEGRRCSAAGGVVIINRPLSLTAASSLNYNSSRKLSSQINNKCSLSSGYQAESNQIDQNRKLQESDDENYQSLISGQEIRERQRNLLRLCSEWLKKSTLKKCSPFVLIISSPAQFQANTNIPVNNVKQSSEFTYFTGLHSGTSDQLTNDCVLALFLEDGQNLDSFHTVLFYSSRTKSERLWHGPELVTQYHHWLDEICDETLPLRDLVPFVNRHIKNDRRDLFLSRKGLQYRPELVTQLKFFMKHPSTSPTNSDSENDNFDEKWSTNLAQTVKSVNIRDASIFIDQLRLIKSESEAKALKRVGRIGAKSLHETIIWSREMFETMPTFLESHIAAKFSYETKLAGARRLSFPSICAGGSRSTIIHYGRNDHVLNGQNDNDNCWVLTDVGCEDVDGYCCDMTRTWPINLNKNRDSRFQIQLQLYEALIEVQHQLINSIQIGQTSLNDLNKTMIDLLSKILIKFNLFEDHVSSSDVPSIVKRLCAHHVSHYIGLDIHDTTSAPLSAPLQPGMCFSVEPGLYIPDQWSSSPIRPEFRNIGLRLEDDILIDPTTRSIINLTIDCPKF